MPKIAPKTPFFHFFLKVLKIAVTLHHQKRLHNTTKKISIYRYFGQTFGKIEALNYLCRVFLENNSHCLLQYQRTPFQTKQVLPSLHLSYCIIKTVYAKQGQDDSGFLQTIQA